MFSQIDLRSYHVSASIIRDIDIACTTINQRKINLPLAAAHHLPDEVVRRRVENYFQTWQLGRKWRVQSAD
jgi:hypothetical protein